MGEGSSALLCFRRLSDKAEIVRALGLVELDHSRFGDRMRVWHCKGRDGHHVHLVWGYAGGGLANDIANLLSLQQELNPSKVLLVGRDLKRTHFADAHVDLPRDFCIVNKVETLEQEMNITLDERARHRLVCRSLPRPVSVERHYHGGNPNRVTVISFHDTPPPPPLPSQQQQQQQQQQNGSGDAMPQPWYGQTGIHWYADDNDGDDRDPQMAQAIEASLNSVGPNRNAPVDREKLPFEAILREPVELVDDAPSEIACVVCMQNARTVAFVDPTGHCQHQVVCDECVRGLWKTSRKCPLDKQPFTGIVRPNACMEIYEKWMKKRKKRKK